jgi:hypothetical protein
VERGHLGGADGQHFADALGRQPVGGVGQVGPEETAEAVDLVSRLTVVFVPDAAAAHRFSAEARQVVGGVVEIDDAGLHAERGDQAAEQELPLQEVHGREG